ncbi:unnamed protein product [Ilex paraguariensis]|uniref:Uncharacterized protein n=1 Tax=Ilex paraguariensis TaxID=185542 RepID=A0ABC8T8P5_9AQUA
MEVYFRPRDYRAEEEAYSLPRARADTHPLSLSAPSLSHNQVDVVDHENDFFDPLRASDAKEAVAVEDFQDGGDGFTPGLPRQAEVQLPAKEWTSFKKILMQRFPVSKTVSVSSVPKEACTLEGPKSVGIGAPASLFETLEGNAAV